MKTLILSLLFAVPAFAHDVHCHGPVYKETTLSSETDYSSAECQPGRPLQLVSGSHDFSFGKYTVQYWEGSYQRPAVTTSVVLHEVYDCFGHLMSSQTTTEKDGETFVDFAVKNSNLDVNVSSWIAASAPMTDEEAAAALLRAKARCESAP